MSVLVLAAAAAGVSGDAGPDLVLRGSLTGADNQTWHLVPFEVPPGTTRITVDFDYTTREQRTTIDLGILGPDGFRGWSGGNKRSFTIAAMDATPSYLPGPIRAGKWNLLLGVPNIRADTRAEFTAEVRFEHEPGGASAPGGTPALRDTPGWYRGDLHMHTAHSDGSCLSRRQQRVPCPLFFTAKAASDRGLDFIAITDHNTVSHADAMRELQPYFDDLLLIPGREITTFHGHANLFGSVAPIDFRVGSEDIPDWSTLLDQVERSGGVISINHPIRPSGEQCMGCGWTPPPGVDYRRLQGVEVVNGPDADTPYSGIPFWEHLLEQGNHLTALGGSDNHDALNGTIGTPTTVVYADELSRTGIVEGIRRGRVFIDVAGTRDRFLDLTASANAQTAHMGDTLRVSRGARVSFKGVVRGVASGQLEIILNGQRVHLLKDATVGSLTRAFEFTWRSDGRPHWLRVDVRDAQARLVLLGNPIYLR